MLGIHDLWLFIVSGLLLNMTPGPDTLYIVGRGATGGRRAGLVAALGIFAGCGVHILAAAFGLSALLAASATAFTVVKLLGAAYLLWIGVNALFSRRSTSAAERPAPAPARLRTVFAQGFLTNVLNPKVALFFLAFLPQFVDRARGGVASQTAQLGLVFTLESAVLFGALGWFAGHVGKWLQRSPRTGLWLDRIAGGLFVAIGSRLLVSR